MELTDSMRSFILHWGEMGSRWGVNRTAAQVHALLYLSSEPLTADEIVQILSADYASVGTSLRELQDWELVEIVPASGDQRDCFAASHDVWQIFLTVVQQRVGREIVPTLAVLRRCSAEAGQERGANPEVAAHIISLSGFLEETYAWYEKVKSLPPATLRSLMRMGAGITRLLPAKGAGRAA